MPISRPLSPHLGVYRWRINMWQSTLHRLTGLYLCLGVLLVTWGLIAAADGPASWDVFTGFWGSWVGRALLCIWTWSLLFHLCNGVQHLLRDTGANYGPPTRDRTRNPAYWSSGWIVLGISTALTVVVYVLLMLHIGGVPL